MTDDERKERFRRLIGLARKCDLSMELAEEYGVSLSTVKRWENGVAYPLPRLMEVVSNKVIELIGERSYEDLPDPPELKPVYIKLPDGFKWTPKDRKDEGSK